MNDQLLTPDDTWNVWFDSWDMRRFWSTVVDEQVVVRADTDTGIDDVLEWTVVLEEDETGDRFTLDHNMIIATMRRIARERDSIQLSRKIADQIASVVATESHDEATDELCQLDCVGFDVIVQFATLGQLVYG
ncbi:hypothetical protein [Lentzea sp. CA-135723]|uniref:hypothetical protein n=1 Tax=Lentzea sp. CA-135723 TaxID=3239950 RepID=UPI003D9329E5